MGGEYAYEIWRDQLRFTEHLDACIVVAFLSRKRAISTVRGSLGRHDVVPALDVQRA
jgi:hypothetical protein